MFGHGHMGFCRIKFTGLHGIVLERNRFFISLMKKQFLFSSELRSLLESGFVARKLDKQVIPEYLMYQAPMGTHAMVEGVKQLESWSLYTDQRSKMERSKILGL
jgi:hypothetical protein